MFGVQKSMKLTERYLVTFTDSLHMHSYLASKVRGLTFCERTAEFGTSVSTITLYAGFINDVPPEREEICNLIIGSTK
jgi:hypothetical protein